MYVVRELTRCGVAKLIGNDEYRQQVGHVLVDSLLFKIAWYRAYLLADEAELRTYEFNLRLARLIDERDRRS